MTLEPLLSAKPVIIFHVIAATTALTLGIAQLSGAKGTRLHRALGWSWVLTMAAVAISSFWIHGMKQFGNFSWIHGLSIFVLVMLTVAVTAARRHRVSAHRKTMIGLFIGALVITGLFTLVPGRLMHEVVFSSAAAR
ncbi:MULTISPECIES: DUF2306 domain-containing protein [Rhodomicrobium]|uniref:DUF2306 domain-containing protein n=1 Tax=Rhodomicrobium TaxID=1068 RepID=UPI000B4ADE28|nr:MULTISPECIES: DUF2306 domain-containing protein [Rhodomicrobium]